MLKNSSKIFRIYIYVISNIQYRLKIPSYKTSCVLFSFFHPPFIIQQTLDKYFFRKIQIKKHSCQRYEIQTEAWNSCILPFDSPFEFRSIEGERLKHRKLRLQAVLVRVQTARTRCRSSIGRVSRKLCLYLAHRIDAVHRTAPASPMRQNTLSRPLTFPT